MDSTGIKTPMRDVEGKVAFITGGVSGIGLGIARALASAGMKVVITYRSEAHLAQAEEALRDATDRVHAISLDVTDRAAFELAADEAVSRFGKVHVLVNNAGVSLGTPLSCATFDDYDWCMSVNVTGVFNGIRTLLPHIRAHGEGGHIVATASISGVVAGIYWGLYSLSKFAVVGMMEALRSELMHTPIGVSAFCPSAVSTNIERSDRNRPATLGDVGAPDADQSQAISQYQQTVQEIFQKNDPSTVMLDPLEVGRRVLRGIRANEMYIFSHPEYGQAIEDRNQALLAAISRDDPIVSEARGALATLMRNPVYIRESFRK